MKSLSPILHASHSFILKPIHIIPRLQSCICTVHYYNYTCMLIVKKNDGVYSCRRNETTDSVSINRSAPGIMEVIKIMYYISNNSKIIIMKY